MNVTEISLRIVISFLVLLTLTRIIGRKEIGQMTFFNFVSAIAIGTIGGSLAVSKDLSIADGVFALVGWSLLTIVMGMIDIKFKRSRKVIEGDPLVVIQNGKIIKNSLKQTRLDIDELNAMLRLKNVFSMADVQYAIFETNGQLSVMKKEDKMPATKGDMGIMTPMSGFIPIPTEVIADGEIIHENLKTLNLNVEWLKQKLSQAGISSATEVFYAEVQPGGTLYIDHQDHSSPVH